MSTRSRTQTRGRRGTQVPAPGGADGQPAGGAAVATARPRLSGIVTMLRRAADRPLWMLIPCAIAMAVVVLIPVILVVVLSLLKLNIFTLHEWLSAPFIGIRNYADAFTQQSVIGTGAGRAVLLSVVFSLLTTIVITPVGVLAAITVHRPFRGRAAVRALYLVPYIIPTFVVALLARLMFLNHYGLVDKVLAALHIANVNTFWLLGGAHSFWAMTLTEIWASWPFIYLMALAGLQSVPREQYEAAVLDGAAPTQTLRRVVLPQLSGILKLAVVLSTLYHLGNFTLVYVMFPSTPPVSVDVLPIDMYYRAFATYDFGVASAIAVITMAIFLVPVYSYLRLTRMSD
jgi:multiple sugar transport system permease protein